MQSNLIPIGKLFNLEKGQLQSTKCTAGEFTFITAGEEWKTHSNYDHECEALVFAAAASGSLGRTHYINGKFIASDLCFILTPKDSKKYPINLEFYHFVFNSLRNVIVTATKAGTSKESINQANFKNYELPYFDIKQQALWIEKLKNTLTHKSLLDSELIRQQDLLKKLKQQILQDAIEGKLTEKWRIANPDIEPASKLLKSIADEKEQLIKNGKIKKQKPLPKITEDHKPFALPNGWEWCNFGDLIIDIEAGKSPNCFNYPALADEWGVLKMSAISWGEFIPEENKKLKPDTDPFYDKEVKVGDFIMTRANTNELIAKSVIVGNVRKKLLLNDKTLRVQFPKCCELEYINMFNNGCIARKHYISVATGASASMKNISREGIKSLLFPLPSLSEQKAIVAKVTELFAICDQLQTKITQNQAYADQLMQAVLKEAFTQTADTPTNINNVVEFNAKNVQENNNQCILLGAEIVSQLHKEVRFGHLKLQKIIYLCQKTQNLNLPTNFKQHAAGPYDYDLARAVDSTLQANHWFVFRESSRLKYKPLSKAGLHKVDFQEYFKNNLAGINRIIALFKNKSSDEAEAVATLYACWEEIISSAVPFSAALLIEKFYQWSSEKRKFSETQLKQVIAWMEKQGIYPNNASHANQTPCKFD